MRDNTKYYEDKKYLTIKLFEEEEEYKFYTLDRIIERLLEIKQTIPNGYLNFAEIKYNSVELETFRLATEEEREKRIQKDREIRIAVEELTKKHEISEYNRIREKYRLDDAEKNK